jgi:hypothetical protein
MFFDNFEELNQHLHNLLGYPDSSSNGTSMPNATTDTLNAGLREIAIYVKTNVLDKALTDNWITHIHNHPEFKRNYSSANNDLYETKFLGIVLFPIILSV